MIIEKQELEAAAEALLACMRSALKHDPTLVIDLPLEQSRKAVVRALETAVVPAAIVKTARDIGSDPLAYAAIIREMIAKGRMPENFLDASYDHCYVAPSKPAPQLKIVTPAKP